MGIKNIITDDLTDAELPDETKVTLIEMEGEKYEVYLSDESKETLTALFKGEAPLLKPQARKTSVSSPKSSGSKSSTETYGYEYADVKAWAIANGIKAANGNPVTEKTPRIGQGIYNAYNDAQKDSTAK